MPKANLRLQNREQNVKKKKKKREEKGMERRGERGVKEGRKATEEVVGEREALRNQGEFAAHSRSAGRRL